MSPPSPKITKTSALYTLIVRPDQTFEIKINDESVKNGSLLEDFSPAVNPAKEIDDPEDVKPEDWVESPKITDPEAVKPEDWDEDAPQYIEDEAAVKPEDWLEEQEATIPDPEAEVRFDSGEVKREEAYVRLGSSRAEAGGMVG
jgi:calnexin